MTEEPRDIERRELFRAIARLRAWVMAVVFGCASGVLVFVATVWLLIRGGRVVGPHLALLANYFPGYQVTWPGAFIGGLWGTLWGALAGWSVAWIYNMVVAVRRNGRTRGR
jgi:hypothetical protein